MAKRGGFSESLSSSLEPSYNKPGLPSNKAGNTAHTSHTSTHSPHSHAGHVSHPTHPTHHPKEEKSVSQTSKDQSSPPKPSIGGALGKFMSPPPKGKEVLSEKTTVHTEKQSEDPYAEHKRAHHAHHRRKRFEIFAALFLAALLVATFLVAMSADANPFIVLLSFTPTLFTVIIAMVVYEAHKDNKNILWVLPIIFTFAFHWLATSAQGILDSVNVEVLTAMNIFFSFFYLIVNYFLLQKPAPKMRTETKVIVREREVIPEDLSKFIASIEDKGKALNFAIGRVYNAYHGGTKELRQKINIKQEWYDEFSQIPTDPKEIDFVSLSALITTIEARLRLLEKSEADIFGDKQKSFKNLVRSDLGTDKVLEVLDKNDKDPVKSYVEGALEFCGKVKDYLSKNKAPEVKNEYVERPDVDKRKTPPPRSSTWTKR